MGYLYKRGRIWWMKFYQDGKPHQESTGTDKHTDAKKKLAQREGAAADGKPIIARVDRLRFEDAIADVENDYRNNGKKSIDALQRRVRKHLKPYFGGRRLISITTSDVRAYASHRLSQGAKPATINRELAILKRAYTLAVQAGKQHSKPHIAMLREDNARRGFFEDSQLDAICRHLPEAVAAVARFAYLTGWRKQEILTLEWSQVDLQENTITLHAGTTKNGEPRLIYLGHALRGLIDEREAERLRLRRQGVLCPLVFHRNGRRIKSFYNAWRAAAKKAGCPARILHDLRRTFVRNASRRGIADSVTMQLTGHKTRSVFLRYRIVSPEDLKEAALRLDEPATGTNAGTVAGSARSVAGSRHGK